MDINLYLRVLWRFRFLVLFGTIAAVLLAFLAVVRVNPTGSPKFSYRQHDLYEADTTLLVTQVGFPWGRTVLPPDPTNVPAAKDGIQYADPSRFASLAVFYAHVANGDAVQALVKSDPSLRDDFRAQDGQLLATASTPDPSTSNGVLPFVDLQGFAISRREAVRISTTGADILRRYIAEQQAEAAIPVNERVVLSVFKHPDKVVVAVGRKKTVPILIFLTVMTMTIGTAFVLENLRPRVSGLDAEVDPDLAAGVRRVA
jgi:hypothetical protein